MSSEEGWLKWSVGGQVDGKMEVIGGYAGKRERKDV